MQAATLDGRAAEGSNHKPRNAKAWWVAPLEPYAGADMRRSLSCLATSVVPYVLLWPVMYVLLDVSYALTLLMAIPASGFLLRTYIVFHDCSHGSFMTSKKLNTRLGVIVGLIVYSPPHSWRFEHAGHHASAADLDRRGVGDVETWTLAEYNASSWLGRLGYRLMRSPFVMFTFGPIWALAIEPRFIPLKARPRIQRSFFLADVALAVLLTGVILLIGWQAFLMIQLSMVLLAGAAGVGSSMSSISSRASTGAAPGSGATSTPRCRAAHTCACPRCSSSSPGTSACTMSTI